MKKLLQAALTISHLIGFGFLGIALYYLWLSPYLEKEYMIGFGIGLLYGCSILFCSSVIALVCNKFYIKFLSQFWKRYTQWMIVVSLFICIGGIIYPTLTPVDTCFDDSGRWDYENNICKYQ